MKITVTKILSIAFIATAAIFSTACNDDDDDCIWITDPPYNFISIVTVKTLDTGETYFQLDDETTVEPVNWTNPYKDDIRIFADLEILRDTSEKFSRKVRVLRTEDILTKDAISSTSDSADVILQNQDPVEILNNWKTVSEDGFMTINFSTRWGHTDRPHYVNLVKTSDDPLTFRFCHDSNGDRGHEMRQGMVAFDIADLIPESEGNTGKFTLTWESFSGEKEADFDFDLTNRK
jgi:hypothetical protein